VSLLVCRAGSQAMGGAGPDMPKPLQFGDPGELGPFRLESRLHESAAGIVYLGADPQGRPVEVALLTTSAAGDAAARDRFRAAVAAEAPRVDAFPAPASAAPGGSAPVVAAAQDGEAPWVATAHEEGRAGAERFLRPVLLERGWGLGGRRRGGPSFQQYWLSGPKGPALRAPEPEAAAPAGDSKGLAAAAASLAALLLLLALLVVLLFSCEPKDQGPPRPTEVPTTAPQPPPPPQPTPSPSSPSPSPSRKGSKTPQPTPTGGNDTLNPAGGPGRVTDPVAGHGAG
jgi:hypothetical protein